MAKMRVPSSKGKSAAQLGGEVTAVGVNPFLPTGPSSDAGTLYRLMQVFRPKDLSKVLPEATSQVPPRLGTSGKIDTAFADYLDQVAKLLGR